MQTRARLGGLEALEERRLLAAELIGNYQQLTGTGITPITDIVSTQFSKVPNGPDTAIVVATSWTDAAPVSLTIQVDQDGDGLFITAGETTTIPNLSTFASPNLVVTSAEDAVGQGGQVSSAVYVLPINGSATERLARVTLDGGSSTEHIAMAAIYQGVNQATPVGSTDTDEMDASLTSAYLSSTTSLSPVVETGNVAVDAVLARYNAAPVLTAGAGQTQRINLLTPTAIPAFAGGVSTSPGAGVAKNMAWSFSPVATFYSHAALEINGVTSAPVLYDYGDAPNSYKTTLASDGPRHATTDGFGNPIVGPYFGPTAPDAEANGAPGVLANGDDNAGVPDDEGGLTRYGNGTVSGNTVVQAGPNAMGMFVSQTMGISTGYVTLNIQGASVANPAYVTAFVDWNGNGNFTAANELVIPGTAVTVNGNRSFPVTIPASANMANGTSFMRIRIHSDPCDTGVLQLLASGHANDGEVEDHQINLVRGSEVHGYKFEDNILPDDLNAPIVLTAADIAPGLFSGPMQGVSIDIDDNGLNNDEDIFGNPLVPMLTNSAGEFWFNYLAAGTYDVVEDLSASDTNGDTIFDNQQGLVASGTINIPLGGWVLAQGEVVKDDDLNPLTPNVAGPNASAHNAAVFLNYVEGSIHGFKFEDVNGDRIFNEDDPLTPAIEGALAGVEFKLYRFVSSTVNPLANPVTTNFNWTSAGTATTNALGRFDFTGLKPGRYAVRENLDGSVLPVDGTWVQSTSQTTGDFDFGAAAGTQGANVDPDDPLTHTIVIQSRQEYVFAPGASEDLTGLPTDNDLKIEILRNNNTGTDPLSLLFGNYDPVTIMGQKYEDFNGNGIRDFYDNDHDPGTLSVLEPAFENVRFELLLNGVAQSFPTGTTPSAALVPYVLTDSTGKFSFENVAPGTYTIREALVQDTNGDFYDDIALQDLVRDPREVTLTVGSQAVIDVSSGMIAPVGVYTLEDLAMMVDDDGPGGAAPVLVTTANSQTTLTPWLNFVQGSVHGVKFHDLNGNGLLDDTFDHDGDDADNDGFVDGVIPQQVATDQVYYGLPGVKFQIYEYAGTQSVNPSTWDGITTINRWIPGPTVVSDAHGEFWFTDLDPGTYIVREDLLGSTAAPPTGLDPLNTWQQTSAQGVGSPVAVPGFAGDPMNAADAILVNSRDEWQWDTNTATLSGEVAALPDPNFPTALEFPLIVGAEQVYQRPMDGVTLVTSAPVINPLTGLFTASFGTSTKNEEFEPNEIRASLVHAALKLPQTPEVGEVTGSPAENSLRFGNVDPVMIQGFKFEDFNGDGIFNGTDVPMAGVVFVLTGTTGNGTPLTTAANPTAVIPLSEVTTVTGLDGRFKFNGILPGTYQIQERGFQDLDPDGPLNPKTPDGINDLLQGLKLSGPYSISVTSGIDIDLDTLIDVDDDNDPLTPSNNDDDDPNTLDGQVPIHQFANYFEGSIHGIKFEDLDGDGIFDDTRSTTPLTTLVNPVVPGAVTMKVTDPSQFITNAVPFQVVISKGDVLNEETVTVTHKNGNEFTITPATKYHASLETLTGPASTQIPAIIPGVEFTLYRAVNTYVVDPVSFDGPFTIYEWEPVGSPQLSGEHGEFWFTGLAPGRYSVRETPGTYTQSTEQPIGDPNTNLDVSQLGDLNYVNSIDFDDLDNVFLGDNPINPASGVLVVRSRDEYQWEDDTAANGGLYEGPGLYGVYENQAYVRPMDGIGGPQDGLISQGERDRAVALAAFKNPITVPVDPTVPGPQNSLIYGNYTPITISGTKLIARLYEGDTVVESGPLSGIVMNLSGTDGLGNPVNLTATTGPNGVFEFSDLAPGSYNVSEGLFQDINLDGINDVGLQGLVRDASVQTVTVTSGNDFDFSALVDHDNDLLTPSIATYEWVNYIETSIHGRKFHDLDADGIANDMVDHDDDPLTPDRQAILEGVAFQLYRYLGTSSVTPATNPNGPAIITFNWELVVGKTQTSDQHGDFWFTGLKPGIYTVRENLAISGVDADGNAYADYIQATMQAQGSPVAGEDLVDPNPLGDDPADIANSALATFNYFTTAGGGTLFPPDSIPGDLYTAQAYPTPVSPAIAPLYLGSELQWQNGAYNMPMDGDLPGTPGFGTIEADEILLADVSTRLKQGFVPNAGPNGERSLLFGNYLPVDIEGDKFHDLNGNGKRDDGAQDGFENVTFVLYDNSDPNNPVPAMRSVPTTTGPGTGTMMEIITAKTDSSGHFIFENIKPGDYKVYEASPNNPGGGLNDSGYVLQDTNGDFIDDVAYQDLTLVNNNGQPVTAVSAQNFNFSTLVDHDSNPLTPMVPTRQWFNYIDGSIHGVKFDDLNGNGVMDDFVTVTTTTTLAQPVSPTATFITVANASVFPAAAGNPYTIEVTGKNANGDDVTEFMLVTGRNTNGGLNRLIVTRLNPVDFVVAGSSVVGQTTNPATTTPAIVEGVAFELYKLVGTRVVDPPSFVGLKTIYDWTLVDVEFSDNHGEYWFTDLMPGTYSVRENVERRGLTVTFDPANLPTDQQAIVIDGVVYEFEDVVTGNGLSNPANVQVSFGPATNAAGFAAALATAVSGAANPYFAEVSGNSVTLSDADGITTTATDATGVTLSLTDDVSGYVQSTTQAQGSPDTNVPQNSTGFNFLLPGVDLGENPNLPGTNAIVVESSQEYVWQTDAHIMPVDGLHSPYVTVIGHPDYDPNFDPQVDGIADGNLDEYEKTWAAQKEALKTPIDLGAGLQYGNYLPISITGMKFEDLNGDGVMTVDLNGDLVEFDHDGDGIADKVEGGFEGIVFVLTGMDGAGNPVVTTSGGPLTAVTGNDGKFTFSGLRPGTYTIAEASFQDTNVIDPNNGVLGTTTRTSKLGSPDGVNDTSQGLVLSGLTPTITVTSGAVIDFADMPDPDGAGPLGIPAPTMWANYITGSIHGKKYQDYDRDGVRDLGAAGNAIDGTNGLAEPVLSGVLFELWRFVGSTTVNQNTGLDFTRYNWEKTQMIESDVHGDYWFTGLEPGFYVVRENLDDSTTENLKQYSPQNPANPSLNVLDSLGNVTSYGEAPTEDTAAGRFHVLSRQEYGHKADAAYMPVDDDPVGTPGHGVFELAERVLARDNIALKIQINVGADLQFGNNYIPGAIHGFKFEDVNGNGIYNGPTHPSATDGEPGLPNILIGLVDANGNLAIQADGTPALVLTSIDNPSTPLVNEAGHYWFTNLVPGNYTVVEYLNGVLPSVGFANTDFVPATDAGVPLPKNPLTNLPYGFSDSNFDNIPDGLQGMGQTTTQTAVTVGPLSALAYKTGASLMNGVAVTVPGEVASDPDRLKFTEVVVSGGALLVGNAVEGSIHAFKFLDLNANGIYEPGPMMKEVPLDGVVFDLLDVNDNPVMVGGVPLMATTDVDGLVNFPDLAPGTYTLRERLDLVDRNDMTGDGLPNGDSVPDDQQGLMASRPTEFTVTIKSRQEYVFAPGASGIFEEATHSTDPNTLVPTVASGTSILNAFSNVTLQSVYADLFTFPVVSPLLAVTPTSFFPGPAGKVYGHTATAVPFPADLFAFPATSGGQSDVMRATFGVHVASVSIDVIADDSSDVGQLVAKFNDGTSATVQTGVLDGTTSLVDRKETLTVNAPSGKWIVSVEAGGSPHHTADFTNGGSMVGLDNLTYTTKTLKTEVVVGASLEFGNFYAGGVVGTKVQAGTGAPAPGITLHLNQNGVIKYTAVTDANGKYDFGYVIPGSYSLQEETSAAVLVYPQSVEVIVGHATVVSSDLALSNPVFGLQTETANTNLRIINLIAGSIHGIREDQDGNPVAGITIQLVGPVTPTHPTGILQTYVTGADGQFHFEGIYPGAYHPVNNPNGTAFPSGSFIVREVANPALADGNPTTIAVHVQSGEEYAAIAGQTNNLLDPGQVEVVDPQLIFSEELLGGISGFVFGDIGVPQPGLLVTLSDDDPLTPNVTTLTDGTGQFFFDNLPAGNYRVSVVDQFTDLVLEPGEEEMAALGQVPLAPGQTATQNVGLLFLLSGTAPSVIGVRVSSSLWNPAFLSSIDPGVGVGYPIHVGAADVDYGGGITSTLQMTPLPWSLLDRVVIDFDEDVRGTGAGGILVPADFQISAESGAAVSIDQVIYDSSNFRATLILNTSQPFDILVADRYKITALNANIEDVSGNHLDGFWDEGVSIYPSGDGTPTENFVFRFAVKPGNATGVTFHEANGDVNSQDIGVFTPAFGSVVGDPTYRPWADFNGNGAVESLDIGVLSPAFGTALAPDTGGYAASVDALFGDEDEEDDLYGLDIATLF